MTINSLRKTKKNETKKQVLDNLIILILPLLFLTTFFILPLTILIFEGILGLNQEFSFDSFLSIISNELTIHFIKFTGKQAFYSALLTMILGLPVGLIFSRVKFPLNNLLKNLLTIPFVLPPIVVVLGFILLLGPQGVLNNLIMELFSLQKPPILIYQTFEGILLVHTFYNIPIVMRLVSSSMERVNTELEDIASTLGSKNFNYFSYLKVHKASFMPLV